MTTDASFTFFTLLLTRSLGLNSVQLRKWHSDLRHGQREFLPVKKPNGGIVTNWTSWVHWQVYSNGASEIVLGKAIKQLDLPREEIVVMTKVR